MPIGANAATDADHQPTEMIQFLKNLALCGTMIFIIANGSGPGSFDQRKKSKHIPSESSLGNRGTNKISSGHSGAVSSLSPNDSQDTTKVPDTPSMQLPG